MGIEGVAFKQKRVNSGFAIVAMEGFAKSGCGCEAVWLQHVVISHGMEREVPHVCYIYSKPYIAIVLYSIQSCKQAGLTGDPQCHSNYQIGVLLTTKLCRTSVT